MSIENVKNRDLFLKMCFMYFLAHILNVLGIKEEIDDVLPTELVTFKRIENFKIFDLLHDFKVITKSGKIIIFEFKKNMLKLDDLKQVYNYHWNTSCKEKTDNIIAIIIVISKDGKISEFKKLDFTYRPKIIKTKNINKQEDLKIIRDKFENNLKLTSQECSLLIAFPLFDLKESESKIIEEMCENIKSKKECIPEEDLDGVIIGMYLNIIEYIDSEKQYALKEMINVSGKIEGEFAKWKKEQKAEGIIEGEQNIIRELLNNHSIKEISKMIHKDETEIKKIIGID
ncbi:hypothetical protein [uncultured Methanobrevibacter sp.]|uniref:hypothetical protein n=1 Tax=uncultured Methanobrevibacter sp. TaxID=253161 RepID=UPI002627022C|nr:hypothetical protein [uncultured Methanobrevibacter sp.]